MSSIDLCYCGVCGDNKKDFDKILKCMKCSRYCHKICSGDSGYSNGTTWTCAVCAKPSADIAVCILCFKECNNMYLAKWNYSQMDCWIHPLCFRAEYTQKEFLNNYPKSVEASRKKKCFICNELDYLIVDCLYSTCRKSFHLSCAWASGYKLTSDCRDLRISKDIILQCEINKKHSVVKSHCYDYNGPYNILHFCDIHSYNHTIHRRGNLIGEDEFESIISVVELNSQNANEHCQISELSSTSLIEDDSTSTMYHSIQQTVSQSNCSIRSALDDHDQGILIQNDFSSQLQMLDPLNYKSTPVAENNANFSKKKVAKPINSRRDVHVS